MLWLREELCVTSLLLLLVASDVEACWDALSSLDDFADCAALAEVEFAVASADFDASADELTFELELLAAAAWLVWLDASVSVREELLVALLADAPLDALRLSAAVPEVVDVLLPLEDGLLNAELPTDVEEPSVPAAAVFEVPLWLEVLLLVLALLAEALSFAAADFTSLAVFVLLDDEVLVVALVLFTLSDADDVLVDDALLLAFSVSDALLLAVVL